jgi:hypothetical protein
LSFLLPSQLSSVEPLAAALDAATHEQRVEYVRSLGRREQYTLFALCAGRRMSVAELAPAEGKVVRHYGKNGVPLFNHFEKRFVRFSDGTVGGYNHNDFGLVVNLVTGPGHYVAYDAPDDSGEVWVDYRRIPVDQHPEFPPLCSNESGLRALVFGDMVDVLRRVSRHVTIGDSFKAKYPRPDPAPFLAWVGATFFATAPFVLCQEIT